MTRRDFELIAGVLADARRTFGDMVPLEKLAGRFGDALTRTNSRFDRGRFETAAGVRDHLIVSAESVDAKRVELGFPLSDLETARLQLYAREAIDPSLRRAASQELAMR